MHDHSKSLRRLQPHQPLHIPPPYHPTKKSLDLRDVIIYALINLHILNHKKIFDEGKELWLIDHVGLSPTARGPPRRRWWCFPRRRSRAALMMCLLFLVIVGTLTAKTGKGREGDERGAVCLFWSSWEKCWPEEMDVPCVRCTPSIVAEDSTTIPRIIHQSWKTKNLPPRFKTWSHSWKKKNPGWKYNLWTDETNREMVARHFPWFLPVYDGLPRNICRADVSRYMYMFAFGGVYADLDVEALKPMDDLLSWASRSKIAAAKRAERETLPNWVNLLNRAFPNTLRLEHGGDKRGEVETHNATTTTLELLLPFMGFDFRSEHNVPNAWMASRPGHPFWIHCLMVVEARYRMWKSLSARRGAEDEASLNVEKMTGPVLLIDAYRDYMVRMPQELREPIFFLEPGVIFPFDWHDVPKHVYEICCAALDTFDPERCKALYNSTTAAREKAWTITYWSHSWEGESQLWNVPVTSDAELDKEGYDAEVKVLGLDKRSATGENMYEKIKKRRKSQEALINRVFPSWTKRLRLQLR